MLTLLTFILPPDEGEKIGLGTINSLTNTVAAWVQLASPVPDRVKPSFVIFDIRAL